MKIDTGGWSFGAKFTGGARFSYQEPSGSVRRVIGAANPPGSKASKLQPSLLVLLGLAIIALNCNAGYAQSVLLISIDGMRPDYVTDADAHFLKIPNLRRFVTQGVYSEGVIGVLPTVTYPSHTTLITGVSPSEHGIYNNTKFYPLRDVAAPMYWYASDVRVPTLWDVVHAAGKTTASVSWPVSVGATSVDYLIPEYSRGYQDDNNPDDRKLIAALSRPIDLLAELEPKIGPYMMGNEETVEADRVRTKYSVAIINTRRPTLMTVHLSSLDACEHESGPFSKTADEDLESIDGMVGDLIAAELQADPDASIVVVSDHGFAPTRSIVRLFVPFIEAGLIRLSERTGIASGPIVSWDAEPWLASGTAAIVLRDPTDVTTLGKVRSLLNQLASHEDYGIAAILDKGEIQKAGGFPNASFLVALKPGFMFNSSLSGDLIGSSIGKGTHGYTPDNPEMNASFLAVGRNIARGRDLGVVDMRRIAPTVASLLGVKLPDAEEMPLNLKP